MSVRLYWYVHVSAGQDAPGTNSSMCGLIDEA